MKNPFKSTFTKVSLLLVALLSLSGCATQGVTTSEFNSRFSSGNLRLTCSLSCAGSAGAARAKERGLYNNRLWQDLAQEVSSIGYHNDLQYFYLGAAAAGLGHRAAARTYFSLANASPYKCGGTPNVCDGFVFPRDINAWMVEIAKADARDQAAIESANKAAAAKESAAKQAAARAAAARDMAARDAAAATAAANSAKESAVKAANDRQQWQQMD